MGYEKITRFSARGIAQEAERKGVMGEILLEVRNLKKYYRVHGGTLHALDGLTLSVEKGTTMGIVGESGCGKSTLGRLLMGITPPSGGEILYKGRPLQGRKRACREIQMIFQDPFGSLNPQMTVAEIILEPLRINRAGGDKRERDNYVRELMEMVGLSDRLAAAYPHELDGGRRQRVGIARALALRPELIICDEPVSALDVSIQAQILNLLKDLQEQRGLTYLFITHNLAVINHIADSVAVMYLGRCVERAGKEELFTNPLHPYTKALLDAVLPADLSAVKKTAPLLKGEIRPAIDPEPGCRFRERCRFAGDACEGKEDIPFIEAAPGHWCACRYSSLRAR